MDFIFLKVYCIHCCCTNSRQQVLRETCRSADSQRISHICWDQKFIKFFATARHLFLPLSHINPLHALPCLFFKIHFNIILPSTSMSWRSALLPHRNLICSSPLPLAATYPAHSICTEYFTEFFLMVLGGILKFVIMKNFLQSLFTSYFLRKISLSMSCSFLSFRKHASNPYKTAEHFIPVV